MSTTLGQQSLTFVMVVYSAVAHALLAVSKLRRDEKPLIRVWVTRNFAKQKFHQDQQNKKILLRNFLRR